MSSAAGSILPFKVRVESCKFQPSILCLNNFLEISKHKGKYQVLRNHKLQSLGSDLRVQNTDRYRNMVVCSSVGSGPPIPSNPTPGPGSWKPWILGILLSIILPFWRGKWRPLLKLKEEVETVIDTAEAVTDIVEKVAEQVEKVADKVGDHLPEGRLKDALEFVEEMAEDTADGARVAGEFIDKVEDMVDEVEEKVESLIKPNSTDEKAKEAKEEAEDHA
ncbi:uncharacterized protein LOC111311297 isoform X2 [Durio zibethinus]|uniref:Uncharacterized protein LOC111311297 isoform X2 n=1 Tax=Durio zibethinus TaxID=66656 RepID=A0A6P6ANG0_DURZI|nr:uncharacterized protein LOC111311297 isoform X2 [Durio zibethinus]